MEWLEMSYNKYKHKKYRIRLQEEEKELGILEDTSDGQQIWCEDQEIQLREIIRVQSRC